MWSRDGTQIYLNIHAGHSNSYGDDDRREMRVYDWTGGGFAYSTSLVPPTYGSYQGFDTVVTDYGVLWLFADRVASSIIVTPWGSESPAPTPLIHRQGWDTTLTPSLLNEWQPTDSERRPRAWRDAMGYVHLEGLCAGGSSLPDPIFKLPDDWIPEYSATYATTSGDSFAAISVRGRLDGNQPGGLVPPAERGQVILRAGSNTALSLNGVYWRVSPVFQKGQYY